MNILLTLNINNANYLQFITDIEDNYFINLSKTSISVWLKQSDAMLCINAISNGFDLYYYAEHVEQCLNNKKSIPKELGKNIYLGFLWNKHWQKYH